MTPREPFAGSLRDCGSWGGLRGKGGKDGDGRFRCLGLVSERWIHARLCPSAGAVHAAATLSRFLAEHDLLQVQAGDAWPIFQVSHLITLRSFEAVQTRVCWPSLISPARPPVPGPWSLVPGPCHFPLPFAWPLARFHSFLLFPSW